MLTKHDERKMRKNLGHIESLARSYTDTAIKTLAGIMMEPNCPPMARVAAGRAFLVPYATPPPPSRASGAAAASISKRVADWSRLYWIIVHFIERGACHAPLHFVSEP